jgi:hypothetical protein
MTLTSTESSVRHADRHRPTPGRRTQMGNEITYRRPLVLTVTFLDLTCAGTKWPVSTSMLPDLSADLRPSHLAQSGSPSDSEIWGRRGGDVGL